MDNKRAQEEISVITVGMTLIGLILPGVGVWLLGKFASVASWMLSYGFLEKSERVIWTIYDGAGLDFGRICILVGLYLLLMLCIGWIIKITVVISGTRVSG